MQVVSAIWYRVYYWWVIGISAVIALVYLASLITPSHAWQNSFGANLTTVTLSAVAIVYQLTLYWYIRKKDAQLASLMSGMLLTLVLLGGLTAANSQLGQIIYIIVWLGTIGFSGLFGLSFVLVSVFIAIMYVAIESRFRLHNITDNMWLLLGGSIAASWPFYMLWRHLSFNMKSQQSSRLAHMLQTNQQQSGIIIQSIADGVVVCDTTYKINLINSAASSLSEWAEKDALGVDVHLVLKVVQEDGKALVGDLFAEAIRNKKSFTTTLQLTGRAGKQTTVSLLISPIIIPSDNQVAGAVAVLRDVTAQRQEEHQRADFISTASHEMRTPVAAIEGYLALALNDKVSSIDSKARSYLEKAHQSTEHLGKLFQDLLTSAKAEDGRLTSHPTVVEMGSFLDQLSEDLRFAAQKKSLAMEFIVGSDDVIDASHAGGEKVVRPLYYVYVDADRLSEVITNLFDNAVKYTDQGKISLGLTGDNDVVQVYVRDTGPGIPADDIPHLFQKFYRVDNSATRTVGGTGLGLFICKKIISLYNGRIWAESKLGKGSTFFINIPRLSTQRAGQLKAAQPEAETPAPKTPAAS